MCDGCFATVLISFKDKWITVFRYGFIEFIEDIYAWLVIGLALAAAISALIPDDAFSVLGLAPIWQMLLILVLSIPLYVCATGSIPLAAVLLMKGLSPGAAFVLLMAGPATNAATITMIGKVLGKRSLIIYLISIIAGALTFGILIDYVLPVSWTAITHQQVLHTPPPSTVLATNPLCNTTLSLYPLRIPTSLFIKVARSAYSNRFSNEENQSRRYALQQVQSKY